MDFRLAPGILIPRPETEILVEAAIKHLKNVKDPRFVEAGVGSGCISISILGTIPESRAIATDISTIALEVARKNAEAHNVLDRLDLRQMDLLGGVHGRYDAVISNPPYIPNAEIEQLQPEVRDYEPHTALSGGPDGLDIVRRLVNDSRHILRSGGVLIMETGAGQATAVADLFDSLIWGKPDFINDLQAIPRVVIAARR